MMVMTAVLVLGVSMTDPATSSAEEHYYYYRNRPVRSSLYLLNPFGYRVSINSRYQYVAPSYGHNYGTYYTYDGVNYYTPPAPPPGQPYTALRPVRLESGAYAHYHQLSQRLEVLANQVCLELHHNYRHNRNYDEVYRDAYQLFEAAKFVHERADSDDREAIRRSAESIDQLFHRVQHDVEIWSRVEHRQIGHNRLPAKISEMQSLIHHLMFDLGVEPSHDRDHVAPAPGPATGPTLADELPPPPRP
jgi:hypothetical protein